MAMPPATADAAPSLAQPAAPPSRGLLELREVSKRFKDSTELVLDRITLVCRPGEFVVVVGPSGSGKSTLLNIAAGMLRPDSGSATLDGRPILYPGPERAMVFQEHGLFPWLTAWENVEFGLKMASVPVAERRERVDAALDMVKLRGAGEKLVHQLSGGMRQRIAIARSLVVNPAVLLMDEPFAALDAQTRTNMHIELQQVWTQTRKTILFVTHSVGEAVRLADRIIVLSSHPGRVRKEFAVDLGHPRPMDSKELAELGRQVRAEIQDEVNRRGAGGAVGAGSEADTA